MALSTISALKTHLGISGTSEDSFLTQLLAGVEAAVLQYLGRTIESAEAVEYCDGTGRDVLYLRRRPVTEIDEIRIDEAGNYGTTSGSFADTTLLVSGEDYALTRADESEGNPGLVRRIGNVWPEKPGCIKVTYTAGYTTVPADIVLAVHTLCAQARAAADKGALLAGETLGSYSYTLLNAGTGRELLLARSMLAAYKEVIA